MVGFGIFGACKNGSLCKICLFVSLDLLKNDGVSIFSGTINGLFGRLFDKGKFTEIKEKDLYNTARKFTYKF